MLVAPQPSHHQLWLHDNNHTAPDDVKQSTLPLLWTILLVQSHSSPLPLLQMLHDSDHTDTDMPAVHNVHSRTSVVSQSVHDSIPLLMLLLLVQWVQVLHTANIEYHDDNTPSMQVLPLLVRQSFPMLLSQWQTHRVLLEVDIDSDAVQDMPVLDDANKRNVLWVHCVVDIHCVLHNHDVNVRVHFHTFHEQRNDAMHHEHCAYYVHDTDRHDHSGHFVIVDRHNHRDISSISHPATWVVCCLYLRID